MKQIVVVIVLVFVAGCVDAYADWHQAVNQSKCEMAQVNEEMRLLTKSRKNAIQYYGDAILEKYEFLVGLYFETVKDREPNDIDDRSALLFLVMDDTEKKVFSMDAFLKTSVNPPKGYQPWIACLDFIKEIDTLSNNTESMFYEHKLATISVLTDTEREKFLLLTEEESATKQNLDKLATGFHSAMERSKEVFDRADALIRRGDALASSRYTPYTPTYRKSYTPNFNFDTPSFNYDEPSPVLITPNPNGDGIRDYPMEGWMWKHDSIRSPSYTSPARIPAYYDNYSTYDSPTFRPYQQTVTKTPSYELIPKPNYYNSEVGDGIRDYPMEGWMWKHDNMYRPLGRELGPVRGKAGSAIKIE